MSISKRVVVSFLTHACFGIIIFAILILASTRSAYATTKGYFDSASCTRMVGWSCDSSNYSTFNNVFFFLDGPEGTGVFLGGVSPLNPREAGVSSQCGGYANHGFDIDPSGAFAPTVLSPGTHTVYAYGSAGGRTASKTLLTNSPLTITCAEPPSPVHIVSVCPTGYSGQEACDFTGDSGLQQAIDSALDSTLIRIRPGFVSSQTFSVGMSGHPVKNNLVFVGSGSNTVLGQLEIMNSANITIKNLTFRGSSNRGVDLWSTYNIAITNNAFLDGALGGVALHSSDTNITIRNNTFVHNGGAAIQAFSGSSAVVTNNIIAQTYTQQMLSSGSPFGYGIWRFDSESTIATSYNLFWQNATACSNVAGFCTTTGSLAIDPKLADPTGLNFGLQTGSPAINTGDPAILDFDGSRSDIGVYGGLNALYDNPPVGFSQIDLGTSALSGAVYDSNVNSTLPVRNNSFENGTIGWTRSNDINLADFQAFSCTTYPPCGSIEDKFLKVSYANDNVSPNDPYVVSDWIDVGQAVNNMTFRLKMLVKSHSSDVKLKVGLQRYPKGGTDWTNTYRTLDPLTIVPADHWASWLEDGTFDTIAGYTETKVRIVLRPSTKLDGSGWAAQPLYYDNIILEQISPRIQSQVADRRVRLDIYDVGSDKTLSTGDTQLAQVYSTISVDYTNGQFNYTLPNSVKDGQDHYIQVWAINKNSNGTNVGTVNGQFINKNITLGKYITYNSANITPPAACAQKASGDANCDDSIDLVDFEAWRAEFTGSLTTKTADFDNSGTVDLVDFEKWRQSFTSTPPAVGTHDWWVSVQYVCSNNGSVSVPARSFYAINPTAAPVAGWQVGTTSNPPAQYTFIDSQHITTNSDTANVYVGAELLPAGQAPVYLQPIDPKADSHIVFNKDFNASTQNYLQKWVSGQVPNTPTFNPSFYAKFDVPVAYCTGPTPAAP